MSPEPSPIRIEPTRRVRRIALVSPRRPGPASIVVLVSMLLLPACSTGAGRTLKPPVFAPPGTVAPETTLAPEPVAPEPVAPEPVAPEPVAPEPMLVTAAWPDGAEIPVRHTCQGDDVAPALSWANVPPDTIELAVTVVDLDAAGFVHWIVYGIDPQVTGLVENELPPPGLEWVNSFGVPTWSGPCPPVNERHLYQFTVHALNQPLEVADDAPATEVISMLNLIAIDQGAVTGTFVRTE